MMPGPGLVFRGILLALALGAAARPATAQAWHTLNGQEVQGQVTGVYGAIAIISRDHVSALVPVNQLDGPGLARLADYLAAPPPSPRAWADSGSRLADAVSGRLRILQDGKLVPYAAKDRPEPALYLVYFGAFWCPPCRAFSPTLVDFYHQLSGLPPGLLDVLYVSSDRSRSEQTAYANEVRMPWPILDYNAIGEVSAVERWKGPGIPDVVVLTRNGDIVFNTYHGETYLGPQSVLDDLQPFLAAMDDTSAACRHARHRLAVVQYARAAPGGSANPAPYVVGLDPGHYRTLGVKQVSVTLEIDAGGRVTQATVEDQLPSALQYQLEQELQAWLFLPRVVKGQAVAARVRIPLKF